MGNRGTKRELRLIKQSVVGARCSLIVSNPQFPISHAQSPITNSQLPITNYPFPIFYLLKTT